MEQKGETARKKGEKTERMKTIKTKQNETKIN